VPGTFSQTPDRLSMRGWAEAAPRPLVTAITRDGLVERRSYDWDAAPFRIRPVLRGSMKLYSLVIGLLFTAMPMTLLAQEPAVAMDDPALQETARALAPGQQLKVVDVRLDFGETATTLELQRFEAFAPDARIVVHGEDGATALPAPRNVYLSGRLAGDPLSRAMLTVLEDGTMRGLVNRLGRYWVLASGERAGAASNIGLYSREIEPEELFDQTFDSHCSADALPGREPALEARPPSNGPAFVTRGAASAAYHARVAIETDYEYFQKFGNAQDAADYAGDLIAYTSAIYEAELDTSLAISQIELWSTPADPWSQTSTICGLYEFGRYWNNNHAGVSRTIAHFLSGKNNGGGVAWVGVLCRSPFNANTSGCTLSGSGPAGGAYGYSGDLDGNFDINNPTAVWDIIVVSHEIGHNFNSPHTMCYAGLGGNANHIDTCADQCSNGSCHCGANALPSGCPGSGQGCGTIMSYCHFQSGGLSNMALTLGLNHPYGIAPDRVPQRMGDHVQSVSAGNPDCLAPPGPPPDWQQYLELWPMQATVLDMTAVFL